MSKNILLLLLFSMFSNAMESTGTSPDREWHHAKRPSFPERVFAKLRSDESKSPVNSARNPSTPRNSPTRSTDKESPKNILQERLSKSNSRSSSPRIVDINLVNYAKESMLAFAALQKIKSPDDTYVLEFRKCVNAAYRHYMQFITLHLAMKDSDFHPWLKLLADEELRPLCQEFDKKIASLKEAQKK